MKLLAANRNQNRFRRVDQCIRLEVCRNGISPVEILSNQLGSGPQDRYPEYLYDRYLMELKQFAKHGIPQFIRGCFSVIHAFPRIVSTSAAYVKGEANLSEKIHLVFR
mmetsp:Transcript_31498/g.66686  ORF Transcript_31498/g.66686 Transcript_31498/m.66686 type:complete len:108 (-) Transcript_31498:344-667(-)